MLEATVEKHLVSSVGKRSGFCLKLPSFFYSGIPDRLLLFTTALAVFIETKKPKGSRFEPGQPKWLKRLAALGFIVRVIYTKEQVDELMVEVDVEIARRKRAKL